MAYKSIWRYARKIVFSANITNGKDEQPGETSISLQSDDEVSGPSWENILKNPFLRRYCFDEISVDQSIILEAHILECRI